MVDKVCGMWLDNYMNTTCPMSSPQVSFSLAINPAAPAAERRAHAKAIVRWAASAQSHERLHGDLATGWVVSPKRAELWCRKVLDRVAA